MIIFTIIGILAVVAIAGYLLITKVFKNWLTKKFPI